MDTIEHSDGNAARILVVEDEKILSANIATYLRRAGLEAVVENDGPAAFERFREYAPHIVLLDYNLPGMTGLELMRKILSVAPRTRIIMMTGQGNEEIAVAALKGGASDYIRKPMQLKGLKLAIDRVLRRRRFDDYPRATRDAAEHRVMDTMERRRGSDRLDAQVTSWKGRLVVEPAPPRHGTPQPTDVSSPTGMIGDSDPMHALKTLLTKIVGAAPGPDVSDSPSILICGETGTGKELVARSLHFDGPRRSGPFVEINCAGIPTTLLEAELFGHERGAFTDARKDKAGLIESAEGGTMFLDEIGDLDLVSQAKLLKVIEERRLRRLGGIKDIPVNARFVAATSRDLEQLVRDGQFRADLYYRLRTIRINVPALRHRTGDIKLLADHFLGISASRYGKSGLRLSSEAYALLDRHPWHGNVRELKNVIEEAILLATGESIKPEDLSLEQLSLHGNVEENPAGDLRSQLTRVVDLPLEERLVLETAMRRTEYNISKAARVLGLSRDTLRYRLRKYGIGT